jgi:hypothetical protein
MEVTEASTPQGFIEETGKDKEDDEKKEIYNWGEPNLAIFW